MNNLLRKILSFVNLNCFRNILYAIFQRKLDVKYREYFVALMNKKAISIGMDHTNWINPSGLGENGLYSTSTARDIALMGVYAHKNEFIRKLWSTKEHDVNIMRPYLPFVYKYRQLHIISTVQSKELEATYPILGGKTGAGDGFFNLLIISRLLDSLNVSVCVMGCDSEAGRYAAVKEVLDILTNKPNTQVYDIELKLCKSACVYTIPNNDDSPYCLLNWNADEIAPTMSVAKVMTMLVFLESELDMEKYVTIKPYDIENAILCSGSFFSAWQKVKLIDMIYSAMLPSSNQAANLLARMSGERFLS